MEVWTEVVAEDIADVHVGDRDVLVPLSDDVPYRRVKQMRDELVARKVWREQSRQLRAEVEQQQRARERLEGTEYEGML